MYKVTVLLPNNGETLKMFYRNEAEARCLELLLNRGNQSLLVSVRRVQSED